jgi:pimeloyl-ACP methyl ester carboxylesterase
MPQPDAHALPGREIVLPRPDAGSNGGALRVHVVEHGRVDGGFPLLLLHGIPATSYLWRDVARDLERDRLCLMPDLLGCGASERPTDARLYDLREQAAVLLQLLDQLGVDRFAVAGNDLGGAIAVHIAALAARRVAGLVLSAAPVHALAWPTAPVLPLLPRGPGEALLALLRARPALGRRVLARALGLQPAAVGTPGVHDDGLIEHEIDRYLAPLRSAEGCAALLRLLRSVDLVAVERAWEQLRSAPPPTLVLWGAQDRLRSPAYGRRLAAELPGAVSVTVADAGHLLPSDRPERVAEEIAGFLAEL